MSITSARDLDELIEPDRVHGSLYTDPGLFQAELEKIWYRTWVFVGHESEVPEPNDYVVKAIGPQSVIMTRDKKVGSAGLTFVLDGPAGLEVVRGVEEAQVTETLQDMV